MSKSKILTISLSQDVYERLVSSSEKMGLTKSAYIAYSLKSKFDSEDVLEQMPDIMSKIDLISKAIEDKK